LEFICTHDIFKLSFIEMHFILLMKLQLNRNFLIIKTFKTIMIIVSLHSYTHIYYKDLTTNFYMFMEFYNTIHNLLLIFNT